MGTLAKNAAAMGITMSDPIRLLNMGKPIGTVIFLLLVNVRKGHKKLFQLPRNRKIPSAKMADFESGTKIFKKILKYPAPSNDGSIGVG